MVRGTIYAAQIVSGEVSAALVFAGMITLPDTGSIVCKNGLAAPYDEEMTLSLGQLSFSGFNNAENTDIGAGSVLVGSPYGTTEIGGGWITVNNTDVSLEGHDHDGDYHPKVAGGFSGTVYLGDYTLYFTNGICTGVDQN